MGKPPFCDKDGLKKGPWTPEEDQKLIDFIKKQGHGRWRTLPKNAGLKRCGKSCRLRWTNYLRPDIKRGRFSFEEEETIIQLHSVLGNKWSAIASRLPGRTDNEIKNYWNTHIRKRLLKMGIDPVTHTPRLDLLELSSLLNSSLYNSSTSQLDHIPNYNFFGNMGPLVNQNLINLATTLLSYQPKASTSSTIASTTTTSFVPQSNIQENLVLDQNVPQSQFFQSSQQNHFQTCTTSSTSNSTHVPYSVSETQLMQAKLEQLSQSLMESFSTITTTTSATNCPNNMNSSTNMWQSNSINQDQALITPSESFVTNNVTSTNNGYHDSTQSSPIINSSSENQAFVSRNAMHSVANTSFSSLLSTPSSSPYVNYATHEDERDNFCSNMFMYDIANFALNGQ